MDKQNMFCDENYCKLLSMCITYRCQYGLKTFISDIIMAEHVMGVPKLNVSVFNKSHDEEIEDVGELLYE